MPLLVFESGLASQYFVISTSSGLPNTQIILSTAESIYKFTNINILYLAYNIFAQVNADQMPHHKSKYSKYKYQLGSKKFKMVCVQPRSENEKRGCRIISGPRRWTAWESKIGTIQIQGKIRTNTVFYICSCSGVFVSVLTPFHII